MEHIETSAKQDDHKSSLLSNHRVIIIAAVILFLIQSLPYLILQGDSHILIHDNLDANIIRYTTLLESGTLFASNDTVIESFMGGIPRGSLPSELSLDTLLFILFPPLTAYIVLRIFQAFVALIGMYLLLKAHITPGRDMRLIQAGVALSYALLPFWAFGGLAVAGLPLLLWAFLSLRDDSTRFYHWLVIILLPTHIALMHSGIFFLVLVSLIALYDMVSKKRIPWKFIIGIVLFGSFALLTHYRLLIGMVIDSSYVSHRSEIVFSHVETLQESLLQIVKVFVFGQYHAHSLHYIVILPVLLLAGYQWVTSTSKKTLRFVMAILLFIFVTSVIYGLWRLAGLNPVIAPLMRILPLNLGRFHFLHPLLWFILFATGLATIQSTFKSGTKWVLFLLGVQILFTMSFYELWSNRQTPTYEAFFAEEQFDEIEAFIGRPLEDYRVVSIGIHPSIARYNGFYTLDGYISNYPLAYKHAFREIIAGELDKSADLSRYFDDWGHRAYIYVEQLGRNFLNYGGNDIVLEDLDLNLDAFTDAGGEYIFSAVEIDPDANPGYQFLHLFQHPDSAWDIYLYTVAGSNNTQDNP